MRLLLFFLFVAWTLFCRWVYVCDIKLQCESSPTVVESPPDVRLQNLSIRNGDELLFRDYEQFRFDSNEVMPLLNNDNRTLLDRLSVYLRDNQTSNLTITGRMRASETGRVSTRFEHIGLARANAVRSLLAERGIDVERINLNSESIVGETLNAPIGFEIHSTQAERTDSNRTSYTFKNMTFPAKHFASSSNEFRPREEFLWYADSLVKYVEQYPATEIVVIGRVNRATNNVDTLSLGLQRAQRVVEYLREMGITVPIRAESQPGAQSNWNLNVQLIATDTTVVQ